MERKRSNKKECLYGVSSSLCPFTNICSGIIVNENSSNGVQPLKHLSIFLKLATFRKASIPDDFMMQTGILQVSLPHCFAFCML